MQICQNKPLTGSSSLSVFPFQIDMNGNASLSSYLDLEAEVISFRGRRMVSQTVPIPPSMAGVLFHRKGENLIPSIEFQSLKLWFHDHADNKEFAVLNNAVNYMNFCAEIN